MDQHINRKWLEGEIKKLKIMGQVIERASILNDMIFDIAQQKISQGNLGISEFFTLAVGLRFVGDFVKKNYYIPPVDIYERHRGNMIVRPALPSDVDNILFELKKYWGVHYSVLKKIALKNKITDSAQAYRWLDFIISDENNFMVERTTLTYRVNNENPPITTEYVTSSGSINLITNEFGKIIRYHEYALTEESAWLAVHSLPLTYNLTEVAQRWGTNEKNVIAACMKSKKFWVYINITNEFHLENMEHWKMSLDIKEKISLGEVDSGYKYLFAKFARLSKSTTIGGGYTLEYFFSNSVIHGKKGRLTLLWIDPPLCDRVLGVYAQHLEADHDVAPALFFIQDEIHGFERTVKFIKAFPESIVHQTSGVSVLTNSDDQALERSVVAKKYPKISQTAWEKIFERERNNGLIDAKVPDKKPYQYYRKKVEKWLITKGYYFEPELNGTTKERVVDPVASLRFKVDAV